MFRTPADDYFDAYEAFQSGLLSEEEWFNFTSSILIDLFNNQTTL